VATTISILEYHTPVCHGISTGVMGIMKPVLHLIWAAEGGEKHGRGRPRQRSCKGKAIALSRVVNARQGNKTGEL